MVKETEFYELLSVSVDAQDNDIKRAYRKLALRYHPDKNPGDDDAAEMFKKVSHAYETLSDPEKRTVYDQYGKDGLNGADGGGGGGFHDVNDIFAAFFGGGMRQQRATKPRDTVHALEVTLEELYTGKTKKVRITRSRKCRECNCEGVRPGAKRTPCRTCGGSGVQIGVQQLFPGFQQRVEMECRGCGGAGVIINKSDVCKGCHGEGMIQEKKVLEVHVDQGAVRNDTIRLSQEGDEHAQLPEAGDVLLVVDVKPHKVFRRFGEHLLTKHTITLAEALCGLHFSVRHLDGRELEVVVPAGSHIIDPSRSAWCVANEGMPKPHTGGMVRGNLYVHFSVTWPTSLPNATADKIADVFGVPAKAPLMSGQRFTLQPFKGAPPRSHVDREANIYGTSGAPRGGGGGRQHTRRRANNRNEEEEDDEEDWFDEDEDSDDEENMNFNTRGFSGGQVPRGGPQFQGNGVHVQMSDCPQQ